MCSAVCSRSIAAVIVLLTRLSNVYRNSIGVVPSGWSHRGGPIGVVPSGWSHRGGPIGVVPSWWSHRGGPIEVVPSGWSHRGGPIGGSHRGGPIGVVPSWWSHRGGPIGVVPSGWNHWGLFRYKVDTSAIQQNPPELQQQLGHFSLITFPPSFQYYFIMTTFLFNHFTHNQRLSSCR